MNNKNELVVKSNRLVKASFRITLAEQRIILLAIVEARETQTGLSEATLLEIRASDFAKTLHDRKFTLYWTGNLCGHGIAPMEPRGRTYKKGKRSPPYTGNGKRANP